MARPPKLGVLIRCIETAIVDERDATSEWRDWLKADGRVSADVLKAVCEKVGQAERLLDDAWKEWVGAFQLGHGTR